MFKAKYLTFLITENGLKKEIKRQKIIIFVAMKKMAKDKSLMAKV